MKKILFKKIVALVKEAMIDYQTDFHVQCMKEIPIGATQARKDAREDHLMNIKEISDDLDEVQELGDIEGVLFQHGFDDPMEFLLDSIVEI